MFPRSPTELNVQNNQTMQISNLISQLNALFPIDYSKAFFEFYPFSNEDRYPIVLDKLNTTEAKNQNGKKRVAMLFGESHFLSMLPELSKHADLIMLADIEPRMHKHTQHLLHCLRTSNTMDEFKKNYIINNPIANLIMEDNSMLTISRLMDELTNKTKDSLKNSHFLSSDERFVQCKQVAEKLFFTNIKFNLMDVNACREMGHLLNHSNARLTLCNFTNIHEYDADMKRIKMAAPLLLSRSPDCFIMYASHSLETNMSNKLDDYFNQVHQPSRPDPAVNNAELDLSDDITYIPKDDYTLDDKKKVKTRYTGGSKTLDSLYLFPSVNTDNSSNAAIDNACTDYPCIIR